MISVNVGSLARKYWLSIAPKCNRFCNPAMAVAKLRSFKLLFSVDSLKRRAERAARPFRSSPKARRIFSKNSLRAYRGQIRLVTNTAEITPTLASSIRARAGFHEKLGLFMPLLATTIVVSAQSRNA
jgi:hypothetical protein